MTSLADWAASGAMALTGRPDGPPLVAPGAPATAVRAALASIAAHAPGARLPGVGLLGERAAYAGLTRRGPWSCGGVFRTVATLDGHIGLSLARPDDIAAVPALVQAPVREVWDAVAAWASTMTSTAAAERIGLLGLPGHARPRCPPGERRGVESTALGTRRSRARLVVVDLSSLWAGPLCGHLLGLTGARVIKVESRQRPDGARRGPAGFFDLLHRGQEQVVLDLETDLDVLAALVAEADVVIESTRARALRRLGVAAEEAVAAGTTWVSITARGRSSDAVGFGDDIAVGAGLAIDDDGDVLPVGDALADPLAGVAAAAAALDALAVDEARLVDVSMLHVAAESARAESAVLHRVVRRGSGWWVESEEGDHRVAEPSARP